MALNFNRSLSSPPQQRTVAAARASRARARMTLVVLAVLAGIGAVVGGISYYMTRPVTLRIAVGPPNSDDVKVVQSLSQTFTREHAAIRLRLIVTEGAVESAEALATGRTDLAVIRGDIDLPKEAEAVAYLRKNFAVLWVPGGGPRKGRITSVKQLGGKRIGVIGRTKANVNLLNIILDQSGVHPDTVHVVQFSTSGISDALKGQKLDAYLAVGPINSRITAEAIAATARDGAEPTFLSLDTADAIAQKFSAYESAEIPAGSFNVSPPRPDDTVTTINFGHHFVARKSLSETTVAAFTRQLFTARQAIMSEFPQAVKIETPDTDKDASMPVHPGAAAYIDGEEKHSSTDTAITCGAGS